MSDLKKINEEALEEVVGGAIRTVENDATDYANIRKTPGLDGKIVAQIYNGTKVRTTGGKVYKDGYMWYEITLFAGSETAWIAGHMIGY